MADAEELYRKLDEIRDAIKKNSGQDGSCHFNVTEVSISLNLALRCITETQE